MPELPTDGDWDDFPQDSPYVVVLVITVLGCCCVAACVCYCLRRKKSQLTSAEELSQAGIARRGESDTPTLPSTYLSRTQTSKATPCTSLGPDTGTATDVDAPTTRHVLVTTPGPVTLALGSLGSSGMPPAVAPAAQLPLLPLGTRAEALYGDQYYPCEVAGYQPDGRYVVNWDDGTHSTDIAPEAVMHPPSSPSML